MIIRIIIYLFILNLTSLGQVIGVDIDTDFQKNNFNSGKELLSFMHDQYKNGPCKAYTFSQKNTHYQNDSIKGYSEWHEYIEFPDKFRIDFGKTEEGNFVVFKNDSSFRYKNHQLKKTTFDSNILLLLLGGMYYRDISDVITRLEKENYKTDILSNQKWRKQSVFVIGALKNDTLSNQIWVDKKTHRVVRIIEKMDKDNTMDMTFDNYQKHCRGYVETKVTFKRNGKIEQIEEYYNIKSLENIPSEVFNPK